MLTDNEKIVSESIDLTGLEQSRLGKMMSFEWLGQTLASLCWIVSVFTYGISSTGDWLQLLAASCWMVSNIAAIATISVEIS